MRDIALFVRGRPRAKELLLFFPSCVRARENVLYGWVGGVVAVRWLRCGGCGASGGCQWGLGMRGQVRG